MDTGSPTPHDAFMYNPKGFATMRIAAIPLLCIALAGPARAHDLSADISAASMLPVAVSVTLPAAFLATSATFTVVAVEATSSGTRWVFERASDGVRASADLSGRASVAVGTAVTVSTFSAGWVLSSAGRALAFIPNEVGLALMHNERIVR
jgi:hypothetical protein